jgi:hypothetical protein
MEIATKCAPSPNPASLAAWTYTGAGTPINTFEAGAADQPRIALEGADVFVAYNNLQGFESCPSSAESLCEPDWLLRDRDRGGRRCCSYGSSSVKQFHAGRDVTVWK